MVQKPNIDIKGLLKNQVMGAPWVSELSQHLNEYEQKLKSVVKDLDLKGRDAREKSRKQLDSFTRQLKKTRTDLEKRVRTLVNQEAKRINIGFNELVTYLRALANLEKGVELKPKAKSSKKAGSKKVSAAGAKKAGNRRPVTTSKKGDSKSVSVKSSKSSEHTSSLSV
jgi:hypothetical protein